MGPVIGWAALELGAVGEAAVVAGLMGGVGGASWWELLASSGVCCLWRSAPWVLRLLMKAAPSLLVDDAAVEPVVGGAAVEWGAAGEAAILEGGPGRWLLQVGRLPALWFSSEVLRGCFSC